MGRFLLVASLLLGLALAGCLGEDDQRDDAGDDGDGRTSDGRGRTSEEGNSTDPPHDNVEVFRQDILLAGQATQTFDVQVPANVTVVDFVASAGGASGAGVFSSFRVELEGCGMYDSGTGFSAGTITLAGRLCKDAADGAHKLHVSNIGYVEGTLRLTGQVPKGNATAAAA